MCPPVAITHGESITKFPFTHFKASLGIEAPNVRLTYGRQDAYVELTLSPEGARLLAQQLMECAEYVEGLSHLEFLELQCGDE
jgi:hypothetical protein